MRYRDENRDTRRMSQKLRLSTRIFFPATGPGGSPLRWLSGIWGVDGTGVMEWNVGCIELPTGLALIQYSTNAARVFGVFQWTSGDRNRHGEVVLMDWAKPRPSFVRGRVAALEQNPRTQCWMRSKEKSADIELRAHRDLAKVWCAENLNCIADVVEDTKVPRSPYEYWDMAPRSVRGNLENESSPIDR